MMSPMASTIDFKAVGIALAALIILAGALIIPPAIMGSGFWLTAGILVYVFASPGLVWALGRWL